MMNEYGEPWESGFSLTGAETHEQMGRINRAVLCVNACAGMSEEEVKDITKTLFIAKLDEIDALKKSAEELRVALTLINNFKTQLNEAVRLLKKECEQCGTSPEYHDDWCVKCETQAFLNKC